MPHKYKVKPVRTVNLVKDDDKDYFYQNYELYIGDGEVVDVRTCCYDGYPPEIRLAQIVDLDGKVVRKISPDEIELMPYPENDESN